MITIFGQFSQQRAANTMRGGGGHGAENNIHNVKRHQLLHSPFCTDQSPPTIMNILIAAKFLNTVKA